MGKLKKVKLVGFSDTREEALERQRTFKKLGAVTKIKKEFGGFSVFQTTKLKRRK